MEPISAYLEPLRMFFKVNDIPDVKKVSVLFTVIDKHNFSLLQNLVAPSAPKDRLFNKLSKVLKDAFRAYDSQTLQLLSLRAARWSVDHGLRGRL